MRSNVRMRIRTRRKWLALVCFLAGVTFFSALEMASEEGGCTPGTEMRLSAPESNQGTLLLIELKSAKALTEVNGEGEVSRYGKRTATTGSEKAWSQWTLRKRPASTS
jgi:hypothetical protein